MSMMGSSSAAGMPIYEPLQMQAGQPQLYVEPQQYESPVMMQSAYPVGGPPMGSYGGMPPVAPMETHGGPGETHGGHEGGHEEHGGHGHGPTIDKATGETPRRCTDVQTCFCFLVYVILAMTLLLCAKFHGNIGRLTHGVDYYGRVCGVDAGVENMPFLFWCRGPTEALAASTTDFPADINLDAPSCVPYCPASSGCAGGVCDAAVKIPCLLPAENKTVYIPGGQFGNAATATATQMVTIQESLVSTVPYATRPRGGRYCIPREATLEAKVLGDDRALGWNMLQPWKSHNRLRTMVGTLGHVFWLLAIATATSLVFGYVFIFCIKNCPYTLAKVFLIPLGLFIAFFSVLYTLALIPLIDPTAGFLDGYKEWNPLFVHWEVRTAAGLSLLAAFFLWIITFCIMGMAYNFKSIGVTDLIHSAFETFNAVKNMYYIPILEGVLKFLVFWVGLSGFQVICSEGWIEKNRIHVNGAKFAGLSREFHPPSKDIRFYFMAFAWIILFVWCMEFLTGMGQFITSYCTFKYYGTQKDSNGKKPKVHDNAVAQGLKYALIYHPGSILRGAIMIPPFRPIRILNWCTAEFTGEDGTNAPTSFLGSVIQRICCLCGVTAICSQIQSGTKAVVEDETCPIKDAYDDVVIRANDFDNANEKAHNLLEHNHKIVQFLYRDHSQTTINLIGVTSISGLTSLVVYLLVTKLDIYSDPVSTLYIADPFLITFLTMILTAYIAFGFMTLWDHTADTLLYCYAWSRRWDHKTVEKYIPQSLRFIVGFDDVEHDRYPYYGKAKTAMYLRTWLPIVGMEDPKKKKKGSEKKAPAATSVMDTQFPIQGAGMGRRMQTDGRMPSQADGSWMSGFGTGFGQWGRQQEAIQATLGDQPESQPLMNH